MTDLYRFFGADDQLLYVGISLSAIQRAQEHKHHKSWWDDVARMTVERFATRQAATEAERIAIQSECPIHNVVHNGRTPRPPTAPNGREMKRRIKDGAPERWQKEWAYAFGLDDGTCPVGLVADIWAPTEIFPFATIEVDLYNWPAGLFVGHTITIPAESIQRSLKAERTREGQHWVFQMDPLADFQTHWQRERTAVTR